MIRVLLIFLIFLSAQSPEARVVPQMALPNNAESWVIEIFTGGGFTGKFERDFAISSDGKILCDVVEPKCPAGFSGVTLQAFVQSIPLAGEFLPDPAAPSICSDCPTKTMKVRRRDATGMEQTCTVSWNLITASMVPADMMRLYQAVMAIRNP